jgi:hypothetical protein
LSTPFELLTGFNGTMAAAGTGIGPPVSRRQSTFGFLTNAIRRRDDAPKTGKETEMQVKDDQAIAEAAQETERDLENGVGESDDSSDLDNLDGPFANDIVQWDWETLLKWGGSVTQEEALSLEPTAFQLQYSRGGLWIHATVIVPGKYPGPPAEREKPKSAGGARPAPKDAEVRVDLHAAGVWAVRINDHLISTNVDPGNVDALDHPVEKFALAVRDALVRSALHGGEEGLASTYRIVLNRNDEGKFCFNVCTEDQAVIVDFIGGKLTCSNREPQTLDQAEPLLGDDDIILSINGGVCLGKKGDDVIKQMEVAETLDLVLAKRAG